MDHAGSPESIPEVSDRRKIPLIRLFGPDDFDAICLLEKEGSESSYAAAVFIRQASAIFLPFFFVAVQEGEVAGYGIGALNQGDREEGWILRLKVRKQLQSRGIGRLLLDRVVSTLRETGAMRVLLSVSPGNTRAVGLYKRYGFLEIQILDRYFGDGEERIIMKLETHQRPEGTSAPAQVDEIFTHTVRR
jgi:ribosomal-protein-alanine N-acetyltransferase